MKYSEYSSYKDSGVEWLGEIPEHWDAKKLKFLANCFPSNVDKKSKDGETPVSLCNYTDVYYQDKISNNLSFMKATATKEQVIKFTLKADDVIITKDSEDPNDIAVATYVPSNLDNVICGYHLSMIRAYKENRGLFLKYIFDSNYANSIFSITCNGLTRYGLGTYAIDNAIFPQAPLKEQQTIANYLDKATAKIDALIAKQTRLIELLKEKRQAVISTAVTRGLDSTVAMKDSGIEWLGEIPEHWVRIPLRYIGRLQNGISKGGDYFGSGFPFVNYGDIYKNGTLPPHVNGLAQSTKEDQHIYSVKTGDVFFTRTSETIDDIGMASTCLKSIQNATFSGFTIRFRQLKRVLNENFSKYYFRTGQAQDFFEEQLNLVTRASLGQDILKQLPVLLPPMKEQFEIANYLDKKTSKIDTLTIKATQTITLLKEKRTALISSAVTGKIDVRNAA